MTFDSYNVEVRERVKCISGVEGKVTAFIKLKNLLADVLFVYL